MGGRYTAKEDGFVKIQPEFRSMIGEVGGDI